MNKRSIGKEWEDRIVKYLEERGYVILDRNYYTRFGEIDIIAKDGNTLAFVEVKYRNSTAKGIPEEAVDIRKQRRIYRSAEYYLYKNHMGNVSCRFDVAAILREDIRLYKNAFGGI